MENLWEETKVQKLLLRLIVLDMTIEFFLECYLNLMSVGGPNYICESYRERGRKGEVWFRCLGKDLHFNFAVTSSSTVKWDEQNWVIEDLRVELFSDLLISYCPIVFCNGKGETLHQVISSMKFCFVEKLFQKKGKKRKGQFIYFRLSLSPSPPPSLPPSFPLWICKTIYRNKSNSIMQLTDN